MTEKKHVEHKAEHEVKHEVKAPKPEPRPVDPLAPEGKTLQSITIGHSGSIHLVDLLFADASHYFIKESHGVFELGGTAEWGTGSVPGGQ